jgi:hypothetical protein
LSYIFSIVKLFSLLKIEEKWQIAHAVLTGSPARSYVVFSAPLVSSIDKCAFCLVKDVFPVLPFEDCTAKIEIIPK